MLTWQEDDPRNLQSRLTKHRKVDARIALEAALQDDLPGFAAYEGGLDSSAGEWLRTIPKTPAMTIDSGEFRQAFRKQPSAHTTPRHQPFTATMCMWSRYSR
jgi:hypothetical protein